MKFCIENMICVMLLYLLLAGSPIDASYYDYSTSIECLDEPQIAQYRGGIVDNAGFNHGLQGWNVFGHGKIRVRTSNQGNQFMVAYDRTRPEDSFSRLLYMEEGKFYTFSAWIQLNEGSDTVVAGFRDLHNQTTIAGSVIAQSGCWTMLKGGLTVDFNMLAELYFESQSTTAELWVDNISLQPFTKDQWRAQQTESIEKIRKRKARFYVVDVEGKALPSAIISIQQIRPQFPLGCATDKTILTNKDYQEWFVSRFRATTFGNEMKWYSTESIRGQENYSVVDAMLDFAEQHKIQVRGHNIFWDNALYQPRWLNSISQVELVAAVEKRLESVVSRYSGQVIAWDVVNENLHYSFFEDKLWPYASAAFFQRAQQLDPTTTMFMNEFNTLEYEKDWKATPSQYLKKLKDIRSFPGNEGLLLGIGLQSHFNKPNIPYMRACLDTLSATQLPIWLTELDVEKDPNQAEYLEEIMREGFSHPSVQGIVLWTGLPQTECSKMCLIDKNLQNLPAGDVVDKLIEEWQTKNLEGMTDTNGIYEAQIFHGKYSITLTAPHANGSVFLQLEVTNETSEPLDVWIPMK